MRVNSRAGIVRTPARSIAAYGALRDAILDGTYKPGELLSEQVLAEQLGMSRTPVRQALSQLQVEHLIRVIRGRGALVESLTPRELTEVFEFRQIIEVHAIKRLQVDRYRLALEKLQALFDYFLTHESTDRPGLAILSEAGDRFHHLIVAALGNQLVLEQFEQFRLRLIQMRSLGFSDPETLRTSCQGHRDLIRELLRGAPTDHLEHLVSDHLRIGREQLLDLAMQPNHDEKLGLIGLMEITSEALARWLDDASASPHEVEGFVRGTISLVSQKAGNSDMLLRPGTSWNG